MQFRRFGRTNVQVPVIGMGTWKTFDVKGRSLEHERHKVLDEALQSGANFLDSSPMYGEAERVLGEGLGDRRSEAFVATKVWTAEGKYDAEDQIAFGLNCFGGYVDLYQVHNLSQTSGVLDKLERHRQEGHVKFLGITHYREDQFPAMMKWMRTGRIDAIQIPYNAGRTSADDEILPLAAELDLGVIVMEPLGCGSLVSMKISDRELVPFEAFGCRTWAQVLLNWILSDERVHVVIPATSSVYRMKENALAGDGKLFDGEHRALVEQLISQYR